jgi:hypothetical protein
MLPIDNIMVDGEIRAGEYFEGWIGGLAMDESLCCREIFLVFWVSSNIRQVTAEAQMKFRV